MRFDRLVVQKRHEKRISKSGKYYWTWECLCDCGNTCIAVTAELTRGKVKSCGCYKKYQYDLTGQRFGRLTVVSNAGYRKYPSTSASVWNCKCDCGKEKVILGDSLRSGKTVSCGCYNVENAKIKSTTHGKSKTRLYSIFHKMKERCFNKTCNEYKYYGRRGITICEQWLSDFKNFYNWATQNGYKEDLTIERKDVDGNYCPENCIWIPLAKQAQNTTRTHWVTYKGEKMCMAQLCRKFNICSETIRKYEVEYNYDYEKLVSDILQNPYHIRFTKKGK